jgi:energy-coupling factor transporter ATP-binding protein EcfA2
MENVVGNIFENGSRWLRADFHLHTKADKEFNYTGNENDFVNDYVHKLVEQNIRIGIITNHNKFDKNEFITLKKKASENGIGLFPGIEFSLKEGIHILIVFEEAWYKGQIDNINSFLNNAFYGIQNPTIPPYPNAIFDLKDVVEKLDNIGYNYFIILAHIDANNGLCQVLQGRTFEAFIEQEAFDKVLAVQKSGNLERYNKICEMSGRKIACVEGSDNAQEGIDGIGKGKLTYLKIGDLNFEAIQYALTDSQNRVNPKGPPKISNSYIKSITFEGGLLKEEKISFSPELNNLIGIRGSGKSSVLEILRYTLNIPLGAQVVDKDYKDDLIKHVLRSGGKVIVEIENRQKEIYRIERIYGQKEDIYKGDDLQPGITLDAILRQPVYFGQKDLSNKNVDFENDLVNKLIGGKLSDIDSRIEAQNHVIFRIINELKALHNLSDIKKETENTKSNTEHKLQLFKEKGVAEKLQTQTSFNSDISKLNTYRTNVNDYVNKLNMLILNNEYLLLQPLQSEINKEVFEEANQQVAKLRLEFNKLKSILASSQKISIDLENILSKILIKKEELKEEFAKIKREIEIPELNPDDFINLNRILETSKLKLIEIEKSEIKRKDLENQLMNALVQLDNLWLEKFNIVQYDVGRINDSGTKICIEIEYKARKDKFLNKLQESFRGSGIRKNSFEKIVKEYADFIQIYKDNFRLLSDILSENDLHEFKKQFFKDWHELLIFKVENKITINFDGKPLKEHSLGQRASALILFLLTQRENDILIIDQPEDDLDNQTIYKDVICEIKKLKGEMQFIFATHNANIPVLGDSEMVVACQYIDGKEIQINTGSIDCPVIQKKIIHIMEGGKEAFDYRKNIYEIWKRSIP